MADTLVKNPKLIVGTQAQVSAEMGQNDIGFATDIEFYTKAEVDDQLLDMSEYIYEEDRKINADIRQIDTNTRTIADWINKKDEDGNRAVLATEAQDAYRAINELNAKIGAGGASLPILTMMMSDHVINDMSWLRADTFSWQSGDVYVAAYEHLAEEFKATSKKYYAWSGMEIMLTFYTERETPLAGDIVYTTGITEDEWTEYGELVSDYDGSGYLYFSSGRLDVARSENKDIVRTSGILSDTIGDITISYYLAQDGHKICTPDQESNIVALYEKTGAADYYLLDTTNKQFKLPRKQKRKLIQAVKNDNGTWYNLYSDGWLEQGGRGKTNVSVTLPVAMTDSNYVVLVENHTRVNGGTGASDMTTTSFIPRWQQYNASAWGGGNHAVSWQVSGYAAESAYASAGMNLEYYYVGNFTQEAIEQTAGLNAELFNDKADVDLSNINASQSAKETIVGWGMPDYSAGVVVANGTHTATVDGIIVVSIINSGESYWDMTIDNESFLFHQGYQGTDYTHITNGFLPIPKGAVYTITTTNCQARFYPLKGVK
jgi:hypothetical protein